MVTFDDVESEVIVEGAQAPTAQGTDAEQLRQLIREVLREELERIERIDVERT